MIKLKEAKKRKICLYIFYFCLLHFFTQQKILKIKTTFQPSSKPYFHITAKEWETKANDQQDKNALFLDGHTKFLSFCLDECKELTLCIVFQPNIKNNGKEKDGILLEISNWFQLKNNQRIFSFMDVESDDKGLLHGHRLLVQRKHIKTGVHDIRYLKKKTMLTFVLTRFNFQEFFNGHFVDSMKIKSRSIQEHKIKLPYQLIINPEKSFQGWMFELFVFDKILEPKELRDLHFYLKEKWKIFS